MYLGHAHSQLTPPPSTPPQTHYTHNPGQKAASAAEASRGYFGHNFPVATLEEFARLHSDGLRDSERELLGALRVGGCGNSFGAPIDLLVSPTHHVKC